MPASRSGWSDEPEGVEVRLASREVLIQFTVAGLPWATVSQLAHLFQRTFGDRLPLLVEAATPNALTFATAREEDGSYGRLFREDCTTLAFDRAVMSERRTVAVRTWRTTYGSCLRVEEQPPRPMVVSCSTDATRCGRMWPGVGRDFSPASGSAPPR